MPFQCIPYFIVVTVPSPRRVFGLGSNPAEVAEPFRVCGFGEITTYPVPSSSSRSYLLMVEAGKRPLGWHIPCQTKESTGAKNPVDNQAYDKDLNRQQIPQPVYPLWPGEFRRGRLFHQLYMLYIFYQRQGLKTKTVGKANISEIYGLFRRTY
ncbi:hypothetical protein E2C01_022378 [Portunus trituberculatus]|uniref:Uncharacterized protein n=1 Tax=Portunus trituberculatus TaxID=210409 RepID=A0A5B7E5U4_PORTR|nr:hypothetical protein [Portunus trituberculatus]